MPIVFSAMTTIIFGDTVEEVNASIHKVLERLDSFDLQIAIQKCDLKPEETIDFLAHKIAIQKCDLKPEETIDFLGHTISQGKYFPGPKSSERQFGHNRETLLRDGRARKQLNVALVAWTNFQSMLQRMVMSTLRI